METGSGRTVSNEDLRALIGILASLASSLSVGDISEHAVAKLSTRLPLEPDPDGDLERSVRQALLELGERLRYALGEYDELPKTDVPPSRPRTP
jgi:hypothetical protein